MIPMVQCPMCQGKGKIQSDGAMIMCPQCGGKGQVPLDDHDNDSDGGWGG